jgi:hypothetical protein
VKYYTTKERSLNGNVIWSCGHKHLKKENAIECALNHKNSKVYTYYLKNAVAYLIMK